MSTAFLISLAVVGIGLLLFLVIVVRLQAFIALLLASLFVAIAGGIPISEIAQTLQDGMGSTLGYIAIVVGIGAMFGELLQVSGGAERIARTLLQRFGEKKSQWALALTGLIVSTPVFFDVALILFIPLVYSLTRQAKTSILYYGVPLIAGMGVAHAFIPPTPGPVAVAALLNADLGWVIFFGIVAGVPATAVGGILYGKYIAKKMNIAIPEYMARDMPSADIESKDLPSFAIVMAIIGLPIVLILANTVSNVLLPDESVVGQWIGFIGHPFIALLLSALLAFYALGTLRGYSRDEIQRIATRSMEPVGLIILVTGAGGVFGKVLIATGVGKALADMMAASGLPMVLLAFLIAAVVRLSQGSATVSMVTAAGLIAPAIESGAFSAPLVGAICTAIAAGATIASHVNDSGFWLVSRYMGMNEKETIQSWTAVSTIVGVVGMLVVLVVSAFL
jgi:Gnt-I system low-affinity gluconate transporter